MSDLEYLCFLLSCRDKVNTKRINALSKYHRAKKKWEDLNWPCHIKKSSASELLHKMNEAQEEYRRIANLMIAQQPLLRAARKAANYSIKYTTMNHVKCIINKSKISDVTETYTRSQVKEMAAGYMFDKIVLLDGKNPVNPYEI